MHNLREPSNANGQAAACAADVIGVWLLGVRVDVRALIDVAEHSRRRARGHRPNGPAQPAEQTDHAAGCAANR
jgi:hypothetical protein